MPDYLEKNQPGFDRVGMTAEQFARRFSIARVKKIFPELGLSSDEMDLTVFKAIVRVARSVGVTPYNVDKLFWLTGSGSFYLDGVRIGRNRDEFIDTPGGDSIPKP